MNFEKKQQETPKDNELGASEIIKRDDNESLFSLANKLRGYPNVTIEQPKRKEPATKTEQTAPLTVATHVLPQRPRDDEELYMFYIAQFPSLCKIPRISETAQRTGLSVAQIKKWHVNLHKKKKLVFKGNYVIIGGKINE